MRIVKDSESRRNEILDTAQALFAANGYDNTSTNDILDRIGIARGTLYYHFKSKEDILDGVIARITAQLLERAAAIVADTTKPILDRLPLAILSLHVSNPHAEEVLSQINKPQNALMRHKMQEQLVTGVVPIIAALVAEGVDAGVFHTDRPAEAVEMCMLYANIVFDNTFQQTDEQRTKRIAGFIYNAERLLGTEEGTLIIPLIRIFADGREGVNSP